MRIHHLITTLGVGGAEKHLLWLGAGMVRRGHEVRVTYLKGEGELAAAFQEAGMAVDALPMPSLGAAPRAVAALRRRLSAERPDILHTHLLKADAVGALARPRDQTCLSSKHNDERALLRPAVGLVHGLLMRRVDRIVALSDHVRRFVARHGRVPVERIARVYYGVDPAGLQPSRPRGEVRAALGLDEEAPVLVCVGRLAPQKDHGTLLEALALLGGDARLLVVGGDPFGDGEARVRERVAALGLDERVRLLGIRHDVPDLLAASDLFVLPSLWEGLGLVFLEAMAVELPVVATRVSAIPEVVEDGVSGWLVPPGDPRALAQALEAALADPADRRARGVAGRVLLEERFGLDRMIDETLDLYADVLGGSSP